MASLKFGLTQSFQCAYLPDKEERLIVLVETNTSPQRPYETLLKSGFRRSGEQVYRPHCPGCHACQSLRIPVNSFSPSRNQRRISQRNSDITLRISHHSQPNYYPLYERYISARHRDGSMYPPSKEQYQSFLCYHQAKQLFIEMWLEQELVAVAVTDEVSEALSALYTFYHPDLAARSLGTFAILSQIEQARKMQKQFVYLGYQIDGCEKMRYKSKFYPHQRFIDDKWQDFVKN